MILNWINHTATGERRKNLEETDKFFDELYQNLLDSKESDELVSVGNKIFRVHHHRLQEPVLRDFDDYGKNCRKVYEIEHKKWREQDDMTKIDFDNHWVSFTDSIDSVKSDYFQEKGLRGLVIVMCVEKAIKLYPSLPPHSENEHEVVAPLDRKNVIDILKYEEFLEKYDK